MTDHLRNLRMGIYRHYKGPLYQVLGLAHDAGYEGRVCAVYIGLQLDGAHPGPRMGVRDLGDFWDRICFRGACIAEEHANTGCEDCVEHVAKFPHANRYKYLGPELTAEMLKQ
jgi:hypothetical protein